MVGPRLLKFCPKCKLKKLRPEFGKSRGSKDGLKSHCKKCLLEAQRVHRRSNQLRIEFDVPVSKRCPGCETEKPSEQFNKDNSQKSGLTSRCKKCNAKAGSDYDKRNRERGEVILPHGKRCLGCGLKKPREGFNKNKGIKDGLQDYCKKCRLAYDRTVKYGIPDGWYDLVLNGQGGGCAICKATCPGGRGDFHVDHDHVTSCVRGLLCRKCNMALGSFKDSISCLKSAILYVEAPTLNIRYSPKMNRDVKRAVMVSQGHKCKVCLVDLSASRSRLDHCHKTGNVRGYLCHCCNVGLGAFSDSVKNLTKAIEYLEKYKQPVL